MGSDDTGCTKPYTSRDKWVVSILAGLLFLLIASPFLYGVMNSVTTSIGVSVASAGGCPNIYGLIIHAVIFMAIVRALMM